MWVKNTDTAGVSRLMVVIVSIFTLVCGGLLLPGSARAQTATCSDPNEPVARAEPSGTATLGVPLDRGLCGTISNPPSPYDNSFDRDGVTFTATAGTSYRIELVNRGSGWNSNDALFELYNGSAFVASTISTNEVFTTPALGAGQYTVFVEESTSGGVYPGLDFAFLITAVGAPSTTPLSGSVQLTATPNPVARGGRLNYTATVRNTGTRAIAGAYFETEIGNAEETLVANSATTTRGQLSVRSVFGGTNNQIRVNFGTLEAGGTATIKYSTTVNANIPPALQSFERSAALYNTAADGFPNTIARSPTLTILLAPSITVTGFTLINAATDQPISALNNGATLRLGQLPPELSVRVNVNGAVESVRITRNGVASVENDAPYSLCGDDRGNYQACGSRLGVGSYTLTATPFAANNAGGAAGAAATIRFTIER